MRIAIVDDISEERKNLRLGIKRQLKRLLLEADIFEFENGENFLNAAKKEPFTCVFLDIYMDGIDGIRTAKELREFDRKCLLIFTTTSADHALEGFRVRAMHYLVKPYTDDELSALFDEISELRASGEKYTELRTSRGIVRLHLRDISYAEHFQHQIHVHTTEGRTVVTRQTFGEFCEKLNDERFFLCNRGMVVNMEHADDFDGKVFILKSGERIPVSRSFPKDARTAFGDFLFRGGDLN